MTEHFCCMCDEKIKDGDLFCEDDQYYCEKCFKWFTKQTPDSDQDFYDDAPRVAEDIRAINSGRD